MISHFANRHALRSEREALERQLQRRFTEKLYDKRLRSYPLAFEITDALRGEWLFSPNLDVRNLLETRDKLLEWNRKRGFVMSDESIQAFYDLRDRLDLDIEMATPLSKTNVRLESKKVIGFTSEER